MKIRIKLQGFLVFFVLTISILLPKSLFPHWKNEALDEFLDTLGMSMVLFGFLFRIAARGYKAAVSKDGKSLIKGGFYSLTRNPMYFGTLLIGSGVALVLFSWWAVILFIIIFLLIYAPQIIKEENNLNGLFGREYKYYCSKTPRFFPRPVDLLRMDIRDYLFFKWHWVKKELVSLLSVIFVIMAIEIKEDVGLFGYAEYKKEFLEITGIILFFIFVFIFSYHRKDEK